MKKIFAILVLSIVMISTACSKNSTVSEISGGALVKGNTICDDDYDYGYELPLITDVEIKDLSQVTISDYVIEGDGEYDIEYVNTTEGEEYNGKYYYFVHITVSVDDEQPADFTIERVDLNIDDKVLTYDIANLHFSNIRKEFGEEYSSDTADTLTYAEPPVVMYEHMPKDRKVSLSFEILKDCTIHEIGYKDFVEMKDVCAYINSEPQDSTEDIEVAAGDIVTYEFDLQYADNADENDLLKTSFYLTCTDNAGQDYAFCDSQGLVILDYNNDQFVKNFIDENQ